MEPVASEKPRLALITFSRLKRVSEEKKRGRKKWNDREREREGERERAKKRKSEAESQKA